MTAPISYALRMVLDAMSARNARMPSREVIAGAAGIDTSAISRWVGPCQLYHVRGSRGIEYAVILKMESTADDAPVVDAECTCDAGRAKTTCKHVLRVLAHAHLDGHPLAR